MAVPASLMIDNPEKEGIVRRPVIAMILCAALTACASTGAPSTGEGGASGEAPAWSEPSHYEFELVSSCGERTLIGRYEIVVKEGVISKARGLDMSARVVARSKELSQEIPTLAELVEEANEAHSSGAHLVDVTYDENAGYPKSIEIDHEEEAIDDEACYEITKYREIAP